MARRFSAPYQSEPVSSLATWSRNLAIFAVVAVVVSILIVRFGFLEMKPALATFFGALGCAVLSILVGLAAFAAIWQNGSRGMGRILLAFLISTLLLAYPAYLALQYRKLPPIHDITTDPIDPPRFEALARLRSGEGANSAVYAGLYSAEQQRIAYPDIETVELEVPPQRAYEVTLALVTKRKWLVIDERPPQPPRRIGRIEAVARTPIMGFPRGHLDPHYARRRGIARRYPLLLALFRERPRQQCRARLQADRGNQFGRRQRQTGAEETASAGQDAGEDSEEVTSCVIPGHRGAMNPESARFRVRASHARNDAVTSRHPIRAPDHRIAVRRHDPARDQVFQMRQHGIAGGIRQPRVDADIDRAHHGRDVGLALGKAMQDRGFAGLAVPGQETDVTRSFRNFRPVA